MPSSRPDVAARNRLRAPVPDPSDPARIHAIQRRIASYYKVAPHDLVSPSRRWEHAWPRNLAMFLCCRLTNATTSRIADAFRRERTSIRKASLHVLDICSAYPDIRTTVQRLEQDLQSNLP